MHNACRHAEAAKREKRLDEMLLELMTNESELARKDAKNAKE